VRRLYEEPHDPDGSPGALWGGCVLMAAVVAALALLTAFFRSRGS